MSGDWPPEWDDPEKEFPGEADQLDAEAGARLSEVAAYLASVPAPVLPDAFEARISAALAAEAAARADASSLADGASADSGSSGAASPTGESRTLAPAPARARVGRHRGGGGGRRGFRPRSLIAVGTVGACLVLAGLGYGLSRGGSSTSSSAAIGSAASGQSHAAAAPAASAPEPASSASSSVGGNNAGAGNVSFTVTASGTKYQAATLAAQVRASSITFRGTSAPTTALRGCVAHLTGGRSPRLVDRATYQGEPAYIIASSSRVWVVGLGCTAANPELIASVPLAG